MTPPPPDLPPNAPLSQQIAGDLASLRTILDSAARQHPDDRRASINQTRFSQRLAAIEQALIRAWPKVLDQHAAKASAAGGDDPERTLFHEAVALAAHYAEAGRLRAQAEDGPPAAPPAADLRAWLVALSEQPTPQLTTLPRLPPGVDRAAVEPTRTTLADAWLKEVADGLTPAADRARLTTKIAQVRRIGSAPQRRQADVLQVRLDQPPGPPPKPDRQTWPWWMSTLAVFGTLVILAGLLSVFRTPAIPDPATPTSLATGNPTTTVPPPSVAPSSTPAPPRISGVSPAEISLQAAPGALDILGTNLDQLDPATIALAPQVGDRLAFTVTARSPTKITLQLAQRPIDRVRLSVEVRVADQAVASFTLLSGSATYTVSGVLLAYLYTGRVLADGTTTLLDAPNGNTVLGVLRNGERVELLDSSIAGWFQVEVLEGPSAGVTGWVEQWLVLNTVVPPPPTTTRRPTATPGPSPTTTRRPTTTPGPATATPPSFRAVGGGTVTDPNQPATCIRGQVRARNGVGIAGAGGNVNNGNANLRWDSGADGSYQVCGLGAGPWAVVLDFVPGPTNPSANRLSGQVIIQISLAGTPGEIQVIDFVEQ